MQAEGIAPSAIAAFESSFQSLVSGDSGMISESSISPVDELVNTASITGTADPSLLAKTVVCKLNGGLGTGMGLDKAKSLLKVKGDDTFLDLTAKQIVAMRETYGLKVKFMLMNSFSTSEDTLDFFKERYPLMASEEGLEMLQNKVPKLDATTFEVSMDSFFFFYSVNGRFSHRLIFTRFSLLLVKPIHRTNGALLDMVTCMPP
jgi:UDP-N-acetylglucosamine pyrophosphorylase